MENIDLSFFLEPPVLSTAALLTIEALAPLSMVPAQPGAYYRSQAHPTDAMIYGMLENALGWHFGEKERSTMLSELRKVAAKNYKKQSEWKESDWLAGKSISSGSDFSSLLLHHFRIDTQWLPQVMEYDDLWSQHLHDSGASFMGGSKHYDSDLEPLINRSKTQDTTKEKNPKTKKYPPLIEFGENNSHQRLSRSDATVLPAGPVHFKSIRDAYPQYYSSPKRRGYVVPKSPYRYRVLTTKTLAALLEKALTDPAAPLYLGSNDGWVDAHLELL